MTEGHGPFAAEISNFTCKAIGKLLCSDTNFFANTEESMQEVFSKLEQILQQAIEEELCPVDDILSGASVSIMVKKEGVILIAHTGSIKVCVVQLIDKHPTLED